MPVDESQQKNLSRGFDVSFDGIDADFAMPATFALERDFAGDFGEERVVLADTDVVSRVKMRAALTNENAARRDDGARLFFDAQTLRFAVATVARGADTFFMSKTQ